jgi:cytochrome c553
MRSIEQFVAVEFKGSYDRPWCSGDLNACGASGCSIFAKRQTTEEGRGGSAPEIRAIFRDASYDEYLSAECTACHQTSGTSDGIPAITRGPNAVFATPMHACKDGVRPYPVMQMMATRLSSEDITAPTAYFKDVE